MTYEELKRDANRYSGALLVESVLSGRRLHRIERMVRVIWILLLSASVLLYFLAHLPFVLEVAPSLAFFAGAYYPHAKYLAFLFTGLWLIPALLYGYFASYYFKDADTALPEFDTHTPRISYELALVARERWNDPLLDLFTSPYAPELLFRLGIGSEPMRAYLKGRTVPTSAFELKSTERETADLESFANALLSYDPSLQRFLVSKKVSADDFVGAAAWVSSMERDYKDALRWWSRDNLGRIPGVGKDWAYGEIALLQKYAIEIDSHPSFSSTRGAFGKHEAEEIERILSRGREANVMLVAEEGVPKLAPLVRLSRRIEAGTVLPPLEHKRVFIFDGVSFCAALKHKDVLETELARLLSETVRAGNIIFVLDNFDKFYEETKRMGSDVLSLLDPFLASSSIQIVALSELGAWRGVFEKEPKIQGRFERVLIEGASIESAIPILQDEALRAEIRDRVLFTYPALRTVAESAERYFFEGVMPDKAIDLLLEIVPKMKAAGKRVVVREDVLELITKKTGIAVSEVSGEERTKLLKLEELLHERIVGQDEAVQAISGALRRARSGVSSPSRPMGSFLFLGPTGVGKTETTKALAQAFFGNENTVLRLDMSEYQNDDALSRLIGTFEGGKPGVLASLLREHPYGVLLLDEFEKTNRDVHDLFLQILDEGFFTDVAGKKVNARNLIIIATSNAGSDLLWKQMSRVSSSPPLHGGVGGGGSTSPQSSSRLGEEAVSLNKDAVITEIINRALFKPELLNRFDGVVLFHPLSTKHLRAIAKLMLERLAKRLREKGLELVITDSLLDYLVSVGQDPKFGARPMNRAIQEKVEQVIAEKMLKGEVAAGSRIELTSADLHPEFSE